VPTARRHRRVRRRNVAAEGEQKRESVFARGDGIAAGRVHDDDAGVRRSFLVDVVDTDSRAANDLEVLCLGDDVARNGRSTAHHKRVIVADDRGEFFRFLRRLDVYFETFSLLEKVYA